MYLNKPVTQSVVKKPNIATNIFKNLQRERLFDFFHTATLPDPGQCAILSETCCAIFVLWIVTWQGADHVTNIHKNHCFCTSRNTDADRWSCTPLE